MEAYMKTVDDLVADIVNSYDEYGGINLDGTNNFPNRETVVAVLKDIQTIIFPGFHRAETLDKGCLRYVIGERINRIVTQLTRETQKALLYVCTNSCVNNNTCLMLAERTALSLIEELPEIRRKINLDARAALEGD